MPFCPECHAEYDKGYTVCADCGCGLVDELLKTAAPPEEPPLRAMRPALLYSTDGLQSQLIANILEQEGIPVLVRDKTLAGTYVSIYSGYSVYGKKLYVDEADFSRAQEILESFLAAGDTTDVPAQDDSLDEIPFFRRAGGRALLILLIPAAAWLIWLVWFLFSPFT